MEQIANQTVSEISVVYKNKQRASERPVISTSMDAHTVLLTGFNLDTIGIQEQFVVAYLNRANRVLGLFRLATGGVSGVVSDPRLILGVAIKLVASSLILSHNHPSGSLKASRADEEMTQKIKTGAQLFDIKLLDHLILSPDGESYFSLADEGLL